ncbi:MAG: hypothetical protein HYV07_27885 [Deltaproteobacteria bacterium]|nr:hypothetical protein [Deltaproteobacteria bacterium]
MRPGVRVPIFGILASLSAFACAAEKVPVEVPSDVELVALGFTHAGRWLGSTGISPRTEPTSLTVPEAFEDASFVVLGWDRSLTTLPGLTLEVLAKVSLKETSGCRSAFPSPKWSSGPAPERFAVAELVNACATVQDHVALDVRCAPLPCTPKLSQSGCRVRADLAECGVTVAVEAEVGPEGYWCEARGAGCREADSDDTQRVVCTTDRECEVEIRERRGPINAKIDRASLGVTPITNQVASGWANVLDLARTHVLDTVLVGRVLVALTSSAAHDSNASCVPSEPRSLVTVDLDRMIIVRTATLPPCLDAVALAPGAELILTARSADGEVILERRTLDGRPLLGVALETQSHQASSTGSGQAWDIVGLEVIGDRAFVALADRPAEIFSSALANAETLGSEPPGPMIAMRAPYLEPYGDGVLVAESGAPRVMLLDAATGVEDPRNVRRINSSRFESGPPLGLEGNRWLVSGLSYSGSIFALDEGLGLNFARFFERLSVPTAMLAGGSRVVVALADGASEDPSSFLTTFDPKALRFEPGFIELGPGFVHRLHRDGDAIVAVMGRTGEILRVEAW